MQRRWNRISRFALKIGEVWESFEEGALDATMASVRSTPQGVGRRPAGFCLRIGPIGSGLSRTMTGAGDMVTAERTAAVRVGGCDRMRDPGNDPPGLYRPEQPAARRSVRMPGEPAPVARIFEVYIQENDGPASSENHLRPAGTGSQVSSRSTGTGNGSGRPSGLSRGRDTHHREEDGTARPRVRCLRLPGASTREDVLWPQRPGRQLVAQMVMRSILAMAANTKGTYRRKKGGGTFASSRRRSVFPCSSTPCVLTSARRRLKGLRPEKMPRGAPTTWLVAASIGTRAR